MTYYDRSSKFSRLIQLAFKQESGEELMKKLLAYRFEDFITDDFEIHYTDDVALLEELVRTIVDVDILFNELGGIITILDAPEDKKEYLTWFVKLFAFIEAEASNWELGDNEGIFKANEYHREVFSDARIEMELDLSNLWFLYSNVTVVFKESTN